jgi:RHS repeat-associated protein
VTSSRYQYTDPETGLIHAINRYYDPVTGQYLTTDPLVSFTNSAYGYTDNNPLNGTDRHSLLCLSLHCLQNDVGAAGSAVGQFSVATGKFVVAHRGAIANVVAGAVCVGTVGTGCLVAAGVAAGVNAEQRAQNGGSAGTVAFSVFKSAAFAVPGITEFAAEETAGEAFSMMAKYGISTEGFQIARLADLCQPPLLRGRSRDPGLLGAVPSAVRGRCRHQLPGCPAMRVDRRVYRSRGAARIQAVSAFVALVAISLPALLAKTSGPHTMSAGTRIFFIVLGAVLCCFALRCALCAIHVEPTGIRVVNPLSTRRINWLDISEFTLARWRLLPRNCVIRLADGSSQGVWAISARNPAVARHDGAAEGLIAELNELLRQAKSTLPGS